jgi:hypothetical protein
MRLESLARDAAYAARILARDRGFTAIAVLSLALGIGANSAIFSLVDNILLKSLPVRSETTCDSCAEPFAPQYQLQLPGLFVCSGQ